MVDEECSACEEPKASQEADRTRLREAKPVPQDEKDERCSKEHRRATPLRERLWVAGQHECPSRSECRPGAANTDATQQCCKCEGERRKREAECMYG